MRSTSTRASVSPYGSSATTTGPIERGPVAEAGWEEAAPVMPTSVPAALVGRHLRSAPPPDAAARRSGGCGGEAGVDGGQDGVERLGRVVLGVDPGDPVVATEPGPLAAGEASGPPHGQVDR